MRIVETVAVQVRPSVGALQSCTRQVARVQAAHPGGNPAPQVGPIGVGVPVEHGAVDFA